MLINECLVQTRCIQLLSYVTLWDRDSLILFLYAVTALDSCRTLLLYDEDTVIPARIVRANNDLPLAYSGHNTGIPKPLRNKSNNTYRNIFLFLTETKLVG